MRSMYCDQSLKVAFGVKNFGPNQDQCPYVALSRAIVQPLDWRCSKIWMRKGHMCRRVVEYSEE